MPDDISTSRALIDVALETLQQEILADLPAEKRYAGAMTANALAIASRRLTGQNPARDLLAYVGGEPGADEETLARAIRNGGISDTSHPDLLPRLMEMLEAELRQTNPRFLANRKG